jgi:hypothetical protein
MYKKRGRHIEDAEPTNNNEEQFAQKFFNFVRKTPITCHAGACSTNQFGYQYWIHLSSVSSAPDNQRYLMDDIKEATPCTLLYVKGGTLRTIGVVNAIVMHGCIMQGWPIPSKRVALEVTTITEGREFKDLDYLDEEEGIGKVKDVKGNSILWPCKDTILKTHSSSIVSLQSKEAEHTPT